MNSSMPPPPSTGHQSTAHRPVRVWDIVVTAVLVVLLAIFAFFASFFGAFLAMASDGCGGGNCDYDLMMFGIGLALISPWVILLAAAVVAIVLLVRRRLAFWVPLIGAVLMVAMWMAGAAIVGASVHS